MAQQDKPDLERDRDPMDEDVVGREDDDFEEGEEGDELDEEEESDDI